MISIYDFIKVNIKIRQNEITYVNPKLYNIDNECLKLINLDDLSLSKIINNPENYDIIYKISSKSFETPTKIISNRLEGLTDMLSNVNFITKIEFENIKYIQKYKYFLVSFYILAGQVFSDGNHRVCYQYLLTQGIDENKINSIIGTIDSFRRYKYIDWYNLHEFIQKLINNLVVVINQKNENLLLEKIENLFI